MFGDVSSPNHFYNSGRPIGRFTGTSQACCWRKDFPDHIEKEKKKTKNQSEVLCAEAALGPQANMSVRINMQCSP